MKIFETFTFILIFLSRKAEQEKFNISLLPLKWRKEVILRTERGKRRESWASDRKSCTLFNFQLHSPAKSLHLQSPAPTGFKTDTNVETVWKSNMSFLWVLLCFQTRTDHPGLQMALSSSCFLNVTWPGVVNLGSGGLVLQWPAKEADNLVLGAHFPEDDHEPSWPWLCRKEWF